MIWLLLAIGAYLGAAFITYKSIHQRYNLVEFAKGEAEFYSIIWFVYWLAEAMIKVGIFK